MFVYNLKDNVIFTVNVIKLYCSNTQSRRVLKTLEVMPEIYKTYVKYEILRAQFLYILVSNFIYLKYYMNTEIVVSTMVEIYA